MKLIGDEVMFTNHTADAAAETVVSLITAIDRHPVLTASRAGLAYGEVQTRDGDCFGAPVTIAARLVASAEAGQILLDVTTAQALTDQRWELSGVGAREIKGLSRPVRIVSLSRK